jgi:hypothetical protein
MKKLQVVITLSDDTDMQELVDHMALLLKLHYCTCATEKDNCKIKEVHFYDRSDQVRQSP